MSDLRTVIARAIKKADKTIFLENYTRQAKSVLKALQKEGYVIVPLEPTEEMLKAGSDAIVSGKVKPSNHVRVVYQSMLKKVDI